MAIPQSVSWWCFERDDIDELDLIEDHEGDWLSGR